MLLFILRKMLNTRWLMLSLLGGVILSVALSSAMPVYKAAVLQRMLVKELDRYQQSTNNYPSRHSSVVHISRESEPQLRQALIRQTDAFIDSRMRPDYPLPLFVGYKSKATDSYSFAAADTSRYDPKVNRFAYIQAMEGLEEHIRLIDGRMPSSPERDGVYEVLIVERALTHLNVVLGQELVLKDEEVKADIRVIPVGVIDRKDPHDLYFPMTALSAYQGVFFIPYDRFMNDFVAAASPKLRVQTLEWHAALDYRNIRLADVPKLIDHHARALNYFDNTFAQHRLTFSMGPILSSYSDKEKRLQTLLWSLNVPVLTLLAFYMFMVAHLIVERQKTEIAVLRSRGAAKPQIVGMYAMESIILGLLSFAPGLWLGLAMTRVLGASNGFLEFVGRAALHTELVAEAWLYGLVAALCSVVLILIPVYRATRATIVSHKQELARQSAAPFWQKWFLDVLLVGISIYGIYQFRIRKQTLTELALQSSDVRIDPMLFLVPSLFAIGAGLLLLRLYPWGVRLLYAAFRRFWPPAFYNTLIAVSRSIHQYQFLMIFLILTMSTGLFSASAARTLNENLDDQIRYRGGADVRLQFRWENDAPPASDDAPAPAARKVQYTEPPFEPVRRLPGVQEAARVFTKDNAFFTSGKERGTVKLMGIDTDDFGRTSWMKDRLLPYHFYEYLNLIAPEPSAALISRTLANQHKLKEGDTILLGWQDVEAKPFTVYGIIDYFPTFNPLPQGKPANANQKLAAPMLVVAHLSTIQSRLAVQPYEAWIKLDAPSSRKPLLDAIEKDRMPLESYRDSVQALVDSRNDPFRLAINGVMTMGFLLSVLVCFFGFMLYWVLTLRGRTLQIGIFRAMGLTHREVVSMLGLEQLLTSGAALAIGFATGTAASRLFVPFFQLGFDPKTSIPPFTVTFMLADTIRLITMFAVMMACALLLLGWLLAKIKINQAVKLGED